jgi:TolA-binding protein
MTKPDEDRPESTEDRLISEIEAMMRYRDGELHEEPLDDLARRRLLDELLAKSDASGSGGARPASDRESVGRLMPRRVVVLCGAIAAVALLGLGVLFLRTEGGSSAGGTRPSASHRPLPLRVAIVSGTVRVDEIDRLSVGDVVEPGGDLSVGEGRAVLRLDRDSFALLDRETRLKVERADRDAVELRLDGGRILLSIEPGPDRPGLAVTTARGRVVVTGTVFLVGASPQETQVEVFRGTVRVEEGQGEAHDVAASRAAIFEAPGTIAIEPDRMDAVARIVSALERLERSGDVKGIGSLPWGSVFPAEGSEARADAADVRAEGLRGAGEQRERSVLGSAGPRPQELFEEAQAARRARNWQEAAAAYRRLIEAFPTSAEARTALVSLASVQLKQLRQPAEALAGFERYLALYGSGSLATEAAWGRACAFRELGQVERERAALQEFLSRYATSFQAEEAQRRLDEISGKGR